MAPEPAAPAAVEPAADSGGSAMGGELSARLAQLREGRAALAREREEIDKRLADFRKGEDDRDHKERELAKERNTLAAEREKVENAKDELSKETDNERLAALRTVEEVLKGSHLSKTTCLAQVLFESDESVGELW